MIGHVLGKGARAKQPIKRWVVPIKRADKTLDKALEFSFSF